MRNPYFMPKVREWFNNAGDNVSKWWEANEEEIGKVGPEVAMGAVGLANSFGQAANERLNIESTPVYSQTDGRPSYSGSGMVSQIANSTPQGATGAEMMSGASQGASIGAKIGGPVGAVAGGAIGLIGSRIAGGYRRRKQRRELMRAQESLRTSQENFNQAESSFRQRSNQMEDYYDKLNPQTRLYNLYKTQYG